MPSWIKELDGIEWYDERYTTRETNQSPAQLHKKADAGTIRCIKSRSGLPEWYARSDVEQLREAYLLRKERAKHRKPSPKTLESKYRKQAEQIAKTSRQGRGGPVTAHFEKAMIKEIFENEAKRNRDKK